MVYIIFCCFYSILHINDAINGVKGVSNLYYDNGQKESEKQDILKSINKFLVLFIVSNVKYVLTDRISWEF